MEISNILVVEDDSSAAKKIMDVLESEGYAVFSASTKSVAVELASKTKPSLVYINAILADASGLEITRAIREIEALKDVPFIMLTEMAEEFNERYKSTYGIIGFLKKPVNESDLLSKTRALVPLEEEYAPGMGREEDETWEPQEIGLEDAGQLAAETFEDAEKGAEPASPVNSDKIRIKVRVSEETDSVRSDRGVSQSEDFEIGIPEEGHHPDRKDIDTGGNEPDEDREPYPGDTGEVKEAETPPLDSGFVDTGRHDTFEPDKASEVMKETVGQEETSSFDRDLVDTGRHNELGAEGLLSEMDEEFDEEEGHPLDKGFIDSDSHTHEGIPEDVSVDLGRHMDEETAGGGSVDIEQGPGSIEILDKETVKPPEGRKEVKKKMSGTPLFDREDSGAVIEDLADTGAGAGDDHDITDLRHFEGKNGSKGKKKIILFGSLGIILMAIITWAGLSFLGKVRDASERVSSGKFDQVERVTPQEGTAAVKGSENNEADAQSTVLPVTGTERTDSALDAGTDTGTAGVEKEKVAIAGEEVKKIEPPKVIKKPAEPSAGYSVQVGFFQDASNANSLRDTMKRKGYDAFIKKDTYKGNRVYRVLIGKYGSRNTAYRMADKIKRVERMDAALHKY